MYKYIVGLLHHLLLVISLDYPFIFGHVGFLVGCSVVSAVWSAVGDGIGVRMTKVSIISNNHSLFNLLEFLTST